MLNDDGLFYHSVKIVWKSCHKVVGANSTVYFMWYSIIEICMWRTYPDIPMGDTENQH